MKPKDYDNFDVADKIKRRIHDARNRKILYDCLVNGFTYEQLAERYHLSVSQIKRIVYHGENAIFFHN